MHGEGDGSQSLAVCKDDAKANTKWKARVRVIYKLEAGSGYMQVLPMPHAAPSFSNHKGDRRRFLRSQSLIPPTSAFYWHSTQNSNSSTAKPFYSKPQLLMLSMTIPLHHIHKNFSPFSLVNKILLEGAA
jgi:hypothetical protein